MLSLSWSGKQIVSFICHVITLTIEHQQHFSVASQTLWTNQTWQTEGNQTPCPYCLTKTSLSWGLIRKTHFLKFKIFADRKYNTSLPVFLHLQTMNLHCSLQQFNLTSRVSTSISILMHSYFLLKLPFWQSPVPTNLWNRQLIYPVLWNRQ